MRKLAFLFGGCLVMLCMGCKHGETEVKTQIKKWAGETMGTYYTVTFESSGVSVLQEQIDSLLVDLNLAMSTYIDSSLISRINQSGDSIINIEHLSIPSRVEYFRENMEIADMVYRQSNGYLDPSIMPLANYWGFGYQARDTNFIPDDEQVHEIMRTVGFEKYRLDDDLVLTKPLKGQLDFSAVAKGYGVDILMSFLSSCGIENAIVDIGGEIGAMGKGRNGKGWMVAVAKPVEGSPMDETMYLLNLQGRSMATSGNYRNFYESNGDKYVHTLNPHTGYTEVNELLSASVIAPSCAEADAWATAFMSMGLQKAIEAAQRLKGRLEVLFIYNNDGELNNYTSKEFKNLLIPQ